MLDGWWFGIIEIGLTFGGCLAFAWWQIRSTKH
jgi:hypothetical protein